MTRDRAYRILGISEEDGPEEIKKKYRRLMLMTHPDMDKEHGYPYEASEINVAYEYLLTHQEKEKKREKRKSAVRWNAPKNMMAYAPRHIFHYAEDAYGNPIGQAEIDYGKYMWIEEEDFSLFLKSLFLCSKAIIEESDLKMNRDRSDNMELLAEITYLLAQQYVDYEMILDFLKMYNRPEQTPIYKIDAMVEMKTARPLGAGTLLYPSRISSHKLYLKDEKEREIGYVSFKDDRLYYGIIPLLERRVAMVRIMTKDDRIKRSNGKRYQNLDLFLKLIEENKTSMLDSINLRIEALLRQN